MILWRNIENYHFDHFDTNPRFPPFLLYVRWKSGVTFVQRCFRDVETQNDSMPSLVFIDSSFRVTEESS